MTERTQLNVNISPELLKVLKQNAIKSGLTLAKYVTQIIQSYVSKDDLIEDENLINERINSVEGQLIEITNEHLKEEVAIEVSVEKHLPQFNPKMPYKILCKNNDVEIEIIFFRGYVKYLKKILPTGEKRIICGKLEKLRSTAHN